MDNNKKNRITGLVIGFIGFLFLFHFSFHMGEFNWDGSVVHFSYILFVWFYRGCIGYWAIKSVQVFYKKL